MAASLYFLLLTACFTQNLRYTATHTPFKKELHFEPSHTPLPPDEV
jgi:hypothetical protein